MQKQEIFFKGNMTASKVNNPTVAGTKDSEDEESPVKELLSSLRMIVGIINKIKANIY
jgi:hypothetical protein